MYSNVIDHVVTFLFAIFWSCAVCQAQGIPTIIISPDTSSVHLEVGDILNLTCTCQAMPQDPYVSLQRTKLEKPGEESEPQEWYVEHTKNVLIFSREVTPQDDGSSVFCEASWKDLPSVESKKITLRVGKIHAVATAVKSFSTGMPKIRISPDTSPMQLEAGDILNLTCTYQNLPQNTYVSLERRKLEKPGEVLEPQDWYVERINNTLIFSREVTSQDDGISVFCEASWKSLQSVKSKKLTLHVGRNHAAVAIIKSISKDTIDNTKPPADDRCPPGFLFGMTEECEDIDECAEGTHLCDHHQSCQNINGSHKCDCKLGFTLYPTTGTCSDINECTTNIHNCISGTQQCVNTLGSFFCATVKSCGSGYILLPCTNQCADIDECELSTHNCARAGLDYRCENLPGSFQCLRKQSTTSTISPEDEDDAVFDSYADAWGAVPNVNVSKPTSH